MKVAIKYYGDKWFLAPITIELNSTGGVKLEKRRRLIRNRWKIVFAALSQQKGKRSSTLNITF